MARRPRLARVIFDGAGRTASGKSVAQESEKWEAYREEYERHAAGVPSTRSKRYPRSGRHVPARMKTGGQRVPNRVVPELTDEMKKAVERSGYLFEQRLVPLLKARGYHAIPNYKFLSSDGSASELDIYAISAHEISRRRGYVWRTLLIECKNLRCPLVLFTQRELLRTTDFLGYPHISGLPQRVFERGGAFDISDFLKLENFHHYYSRAKTATQFCAIAERSRKGSTGGTEGGKPTKRNTDDYIAGHHVGDIDLYGDGIFKLVQAVRNDKRDFAARFSAKEIADQRVDLWFHYPIFVTAGTLYECQVTDRRPRYRRVHTAGFLHRGIQTAAGLADDCRIDIVDASGLRVLLQRIERETDRVVEIGTQVTV